jgi:hypothetical protein
MNASDIRQKILDAVDANFDAQLATTRDFVAIPRGRHLPACERSRQIAYPAGSLRRRSDRTAGDAGDAAVFAGRQRRQDVRPRRLRHEVRHHRCALRSRRDQGRRPPADRADPLPVRDRRGKHRRRGLVGCRLPGHALTDASTASSWRGRTIGKSPKQNRRLMVATHYSRAVPSWCAPAATKQPVGQNFAFAVGQITFRTPAILSPRKGRWPSSPNVGMGCGGRGGVGREVCSQGGFP